MRVSTKTPRPQERAARDRARPPETPTPLAPLLIVTRMGRDYRPGPRQRIEMEWLPPSLTAIRCAKKCRPESSLSGKDDDDGYDDRDRSGKARFSISRRHDDGRSPGSSKAAARQGARVHDDAGARRRGDGGVRQRALLGPRISQHGPCRQADRPAVCSAIRETAKERCCRCRGDCRGGAAT